ncbi:hypothetical protein PCE1_002188 [Barthelona sp. PCE]
MSHPDTPDLGDLLESFREHYNMCVMDIRSIFSLSFNYLEPEVASAVYELVEELKAQSDDLCAQWSDLLYHLEAYNEYYSRRKASQLHIELDSFLMALFETLTVVLKLTHQTDIKEEHIKLLEKLFQSLEDARFVRKQIHHDIKVQLKGALFLKKSTGNFFTIITSIIVLFVLILFFKKIIQKAKMSN